MANRENVDEAFARWSALAGELQIPDVGFLNSDRRAALTQRLAEVGGLQGWAIFLEKIREAEFLRGPDGRPKFWVGLGKLLEPEHFSKILEDRYAELHKIRRGGKPDLVSTIAAFAKAGAERDVGDANEAGPRDVGGAVDADGEPDQAPPPAADDPTPEQRARLRQLDEDARRLADATGMALDEVSKQMHAWRAALMDAGLGRVDAGLVIADLAKEAPATEGALQILEISIAGHIAARAAA
jgi:hypothetical protein